MIALNEYTIPDFYDTKAHMDALKQYGVCPIHRKFFAPIANIIKQPIFVKVIEPKNGYQSMLEIRVDSWM